MRRFLSLWLCLSSLACSALAHAEWYSATENKMGTRVRIEIWHDDADEAEALLESGMREFDRIERSMSTYIAESEISLINDTAADGAVVVGSELLALIARALELSEMTEGAFDITYDSVGQMYDYRENRKPKVDAIQAALPAVDYRLVELDPEASTIRFLRPGIRINLGGIAKGYACESVVAVLRDSGVTNALVNAGGDTRLLGDRGNGPWVVGVRDPEDESGVVTRLAADDEAVSTSGDYERFFIEDGVRYHHILSPATGKSVDDVRSVTVVGPDATMTDGLSTSVFVLGPRAGLDLIETLPDYEAIVIDSERRIRLSTGFQAR